MTEEEQVLEQFKQAYPNLSNEQLCLTIISLDKSGIEKKLRLAKRDRIRLAGLVLVWISLKDGKKDTEAIRSAQKFVDLHFYTADSHVVKDEYIKELWKRKKKSPELLANTIRSYVLEMIPQLEIQGAVTVDSSSGIKTVDSLKLWNLIFHNPLRDNVFDIQTFEDFMFAIRQSLEYGWIDDHDEGCVLAIGQSLQQDWAGPDK